MKLALHCKDKMGYFLNFWKKSLTSPNTEHSKQFLKHSDTRAIWCQDSSLVLAKEDDTYSTGLKEDTIAL